MSGVQFNPDEDIPDLSGKVILVTGGNIGLGKETIYQLSKHNPAHIYLAARNKSKADATISQIKKTVPNAPISFVELDLTSFESIRKAASTVNAETDRLHHLYNNAGIMACPAETTKEGYEIQFGTNHVGHALLTKLLLPRLKATAAAQSGADVRIINLSSGAHAWAPSEGYLLDQTKSPMTSITTWQRYGQSKLANIHYNRELAKRHPDIKCVSIHPGSVATNLTAGPAASYPWVAWAIPLFARFRQVSVQTGCLNQLWAATAKDVKTGVYYCPVGVEGKDSQLARDEGLGRRLWEWTEEELKGVEL